VNSSAIAGISSSAKIAVPDAFAATCAPPKTGPTSVSVFAAPAPAAGINERRITEIRNLSATRIYRRGYHRPSSHPCSVQVRVFNNHRLRGRTPAVKVMTIRPDVNDSMLSMETVPTGLPVPGWLFDALRGVTKSRLLVIHSSEQARRQAIDTLLDSQGGGILDTTHHLTLGRLISQLHLDLRLPKLLVDDAILFERTHAALSAAAKDLQFPLLHPDPQVAWSRSKSEYLLKLHSGLMGLESPWSWDEDPGAKECDEILQKLQQKYGGIHPARREFELLNALKNSGESSLFSLSECDGIIMLDHPPGLKEIQLAILRTLSRLIPIHQLVNPGSYRLGHHGEFIADIHPCRTEKELPQWVPPHRVWISDVPNWLSPIGEKRNTKYHRIQVENNSHCDYAVLELIADLPEVTIVSGAPESLIKRIGPQLEEMGIQLQKNSEPIVNMAAISRLISIMKLGHGLDGWSLAKVSGFSRQVSLPLDLETIFAVEHPTDPTIIPRLHIDLISELARSFHLLGGRGALRRWLSALSSPSYRPQHNAKARLRQQEESQWWFACMASWLAPLIEDDEHQEILSELQGCFSAEKLPLPEEQFDGHSWLYNLRSCLQETAEKDIIDTIDTLLEQSRELARGLRATEYIAMIESLTEKTMDDPPRSGDYSSRICSIDQVHGVELNSVILTDIDGDSWSMKDSGFPWMDEESRIRLGLARPDEEMRRGRHHLRHLLNCSKSLIIIDPSPEEGIELSGPVAEWFNKLRRTNKMDILRDAPPSIPESRWQKGGEGRSWAWRSRTDGNWLTLRRVIIEPENGDFRTIISGRRRRDLQQRAGIAASENRTPQFAPFAIGNIATAAEAAILEDISSRFQIDVMLKEGEILSSSRVAELIDANPLQLLPNHHNPANSRDDSEWPHLGKMTKRGIGVGIDPRPIQANPLGETIIDGRMGRAKKQLSMPKVWSASRLQQWLDCPRRAWFSNHLGAGTRDSVEEDLASSIRGDLIHLSEEALIRTHLEECDQPTPMHLGPITSKNKGWISILETLAERAPWMKRDDAIAFHRVRDMIGSTPEQWRLWLNDGIEIPQGGRLGRMLDSDLLLHDAAPIYSEWCVGLDGVEPALLSLPEDGGYISFRGRVDRVDEVLGLDQFKDVNSTGVIPLDLELNSDIKAKRLVIIRDLKTVEGAGDNGRGDKHKKSIFTDLQLALYARAWEIFNPGDRVIGVGITVVGKETVHRVEIDPQFSQHMTDLEIGEQTKHTHLHYRLPGEEIPARSNPFRAWMRERLTTALRIEDSARKGNIPPNPSNACNHCPVANACPSSKAGDGLG